jgi:hypothetical protein
VRAVGSRSHGSLRTGGPVTPRAPYWRNLTTRLGLIVDTFESAIPWNAFDDFYAGVTDRNFAISMGISVPDPGFRGVATMTCNLLIFQGN